jgi:hypothetical protein
VPLQRVSDNVGLASGSVGGFGGQAVKSINVVVGAKRQRRTGGLRLRLRRSLGRDSTFEIRVVAPGAVGRAQRYRVLGNQIRRVSSRCFEHGHGTVAC